MNNAMKYTALIAAILIALTVTCTICSKYISAEEPSAEAASNAKDGAGMFITVGHEASGDIMVDKDTRVMYWKSTDYNNNGTLTLLVNSDGTPRIWED